MSAYDDYAMRFLEGLYKETEESGGEYHRVRDIHKKYGLNPKPHWISRMADDWEHTYFKDVTRVLGGHESWDFRISAEGARIIENFFESDEIVSSVFGDDTAIKPDSAVHGHSATEASITSHPRKVDSTTWIGGQLVLTDAKVLRLLRHQATELRDRVHATRFESNVDSQDLKSLADALVAVCEMAEPELGIIERILAHPKFQYTAALAAAVATIRGALGI